MFISLIDYFLEQQLSVTNNDCWNFYKRKQQYCLVDSVKYLLCKNDIYQLILQNSLGRFPFHENSSSINAEKLTRG